MLDVVFNKNQEEKLYFFSSSRLKAEYYLQFEDEFSRTMEFSIENMDSLNPNLKVACQRMLTYYAMLIMKPSDFLIIDKFKSLQRKEIMLKLLCEGTTLSDDVLYALFSNPEVINALPNGEWLEYCARRSTKVLIHYAMGREISWHEAFPNAHEIPDFTRQYIYSWIYEEAQMDEDFLRRFESQFPDKYKHLSSFMSTRR